MVNIFLLFVSHVHNVVISRFLSMEILLMEAIGDGEGDYNCTKEEVQAMIRDSLIKTQDMIVLENMDLNVFDYDSVKCYRIRMKLYRPGHVWEELEDVEFLYKMGAVGRTEDGKMHPTTAGLLMFGYEYEIVKEFPFLFP